jgi:hypothetical protein
MKTTRKSAIGLKGQIKVEVLDHTGNVIEERPWQDNLILDQGLNNMADKYVAQLFEWAAAGTGGELLDPPEITLPAREAMPTNNDYTQTVVGNGGSLARTIATGGRPFAASDVGKLVKRTTGALEESIITTFTDADNVSVVGVNNAPVVAYSGSNIVLYSVLQKGLQAEVGPRTNQYSAITGHNSTTYVLTDGVATLQRTFVFQPIPEATTTEDITDTTYHRAGNKVRLNGGPRDFKQSDEGKRIVFKTAGVESMCTITNFVSAIEVDVDGPSATIAEQVTSRMPRSASATTARQATTSTSACGWRPLRECPSPSTSSVPTRARLASSCASLTSSRSLRNLSTRPRATRTSPAWAAVRAENTPSSASP